MTIQETLNELDAITKRMSETDSLEQSFAEYEKCNNSCNQNN